LSRVARLLATGAVVLSAATGLAFGLLVPTFARADTPPPTTVSTPTVPTPDPAPAPNPKPAPKPAPKSTPTPRHVSQAPTYQPPVAPASSSTPAATVKPKTRVHVKPKKVRHKKAVVKKKTTPLPKISLAPPVGAVGVQVALKTKSGGSIGLASLLVVLGLSFAIACFAVAAVPATYVKWRPAAIFVSERQVDLTLVGVALLVGAAFTFLLAKGL
jgi:hypothetical protein